MKATEVTAGLAESNGIRLLPGLWRDSLHVTCGLTACRPTPESAPGPTLGNEYGKTLPFLPVSSGWEVTVCLASHRSQTLRNIHLQAQMATEREKPAYAQLLHSVLHLLIFYLGGSVAEWLACWTQAQKGPGSNRSRDAVG